jgi:iron-sulfur cluster repair protein YtfE (RIC family)
MRRITTMTTRNLPGSDAARHGTADADLTIMLAAHAAFRRDLSRLAHAAALADPLDPARRASVQAGWETFKRQLHLHHTAEDTLVWPALRQRLDHSEHAQSVLDEMEAEHQLIDPLLAAVDDAFGGALGGALGGPLGGAFGGAVSVAAATDALADSLSSHLAHEERDGLPLIGVALTAAEWRGVGVKIARRSGLSNAGEMFAWIADGADPDQAAAAVGALPPPARLVYRAIWKPRYQHTRRW